MAKRTPKDAPPPEPITYHVSAVVTAPGVHKTYEGDLTVTDGAPPPTVAQAPEIVAHPLSTTIAPGDSATLTVAATGTEPLGYQWHAPIGDAPNPIPGATSPTFDTGPLTDTAAYLCTVDNAAGAANSNPATVTVAAIIITPPPSDLGLTFVRTIGLPPLQMGYAYGDCTGRIVDGNVRLLFSGDNVNVGSPIYEVEITPDPVARFVQAWDNPYNGKRGTWIQSTTALATADALDAEADRRRLPWLHVAADWYRRLARKIPKDAWYFLDFSTASTPALNGSHFYHPELDLLFVTYADSYNVSGRPDWNCVGIRLHPDGIADTFGPWRLASRSGDGEIRLGPRGVMSLRAHPTRGDMLGCTSLGSGNIGYPWGANLVGGAPWMTPATPAGPTVPDVQLFDCYLFGYYMGHAIDPLTGIATGPVRSGRRPLHPYVYEPFADADACNFVDPQHYQGIGSWTDNDSLCGFFPLPDRTYFFGGVAGSPIQDPHNPGAAHVFYANGANEFTCTHGFAAVPAGITGPTSTARFPFANAYANADLDRVRRGQAVDWEVEPYVWSNLEHDFGIVTAPIDSVGNAKSIASGFFDPNTRKLYCIAQGADRGQVTWGLINAYIHEFDVA